MTLKTTAVAIAFLVASGASVLAQTAQPAQQPARPAAPAAQPARPATAPAAPATAQPARPATPAAQNQLVNLNTAPATELDKLPQIGEARAKSIIEKRPYKDWNDFVAKGVIPSNAEAAIKDKVRFR